MNRYDFQKISHMREEEASVLLTAGHFEGANYLMGYAVECALKACFAKQVKEFDFPGKDSTKLYTHNLETLLKFAGLEQELAAASVLNPSFAKNWILVKDWKEDVRYSFGLSGKAAQDYRTACIGPNGVLNWIRQRW
jgi:hypothetical protein